MKRSRSITSKIPSVLAIALLLLVWQALSSFEIIPRFLLPSPLDVLKAFGEDFFVLMEHAQVTLAEAFFGLVLGVTTGVLFAVLMDASALINKTVYPLLVLTQTVPTVAIAPLLVLWMGYGMLPKVILIVITAFFPVTIGMLSGFAGTDQDTIHLMQSMGASKRQIFTMVKLPNSLEQFFAGLKIAVTYSVVGAVIAEWLGGFSGLGVYMTRVKKSYSYDKMFAVIFLISAISLLLMAAVKVLQKKCMPWDKYNEKNSAM
ncbi:MAG: ABC transporter permease [Lachnospiraceae bacterium]